MALLLICLMSSVVLQMAMRYECRHIINIYTGRVTINVLVPYRYSYIIENVDLQS